MLGNAIKSTKQPGALNSTQESRQASENRSISFDHAETSQRKSEVEGGGTKQTGLKEDDCVANMAPFIADTQSFRFETSMVSGPLFVVLIKARFDST